MTEPQTPAVADAADLKALQGAAEGLDPGGRHGLGPGRRVQLRSRAEVGSGLCLHRVAGL